jgi:hypothetical protein
MTAPQDTAPRLVRNGHDVDKIVQAWLEHHFPDDVREKWSNRKGYYAVCMSMDSPRDPRIFALIMYYAGYDEKPLVKSRIDAAAALLADAGATYEVKRGTLAVAPPTRSMPC